MTYEFRNNTYVHFENNAYFGKHTYGIPHLSLHSHYGDNYLVFGNFCSIANNVNIFTGGNHRTEWVTTYPFGHERKDIFNTIDGKGHPTSKGDVIIGNDVWIATNATIMSGVTVGDGAVIAANSHVVKNVEPYTIVGGNPAKYIKHRFTEEQIKKLLEIKWWYWEDEKINQFLPLLCNDDIDAFINAAMQ
jgi:acetyltransferase-like isoleucine patch superfamily enzyme